MPAQGSGEDGDAGVPMTLASIEGWKRLVFRSQRLTAAARLSKVVAWRLRMRPHEDDFLAFRWLGIEQGVAIDVGANLGQSAISLISVAPGLKVTSLECNPACLPPLKLLARLLAGRMSVIGAGAGSQKGELKFYIPTRNGRELLQEGTFDRKSLQTTASIERLGYEGEGYSLRQRFCPIVTLDSLELAPAIIKIDVQGWEHEVLEGAKATISRARPVVMLERSDNEDQCAALLAANGYQRKYWSGRELVAEAPTSSFNVFFVARE